MQMHCLSRELILEMLGELGADFKPVTRRSHAINPESRLHTSLHLLVSELLQFMLLGLPGGTFHGYCPKS